MKAIVFGSKTLGFKGLSYLLTQDIEIVGVFTAPHKKEFKYPDLMAELAEHNNIKTFHLEDVNSPESIKLIKGLDPDFVFLFSYHQILGKEFLAIPKISVTNIHFSLLPFYAGSGGLHAVLASGEKKMGVTLYYLDEGIDTGDVIGQAVVDVFPTDNPDSLYDRCCDHAIVLFNEFFQLIVEEKAPRLKQDLNKRTYFDRNYLANLKNEK